MAYNNQSNALFRINFALWWILSVLWSYHLKLHGDVCCVLFLHNFKACTGRETDKFLPRLMNPPPLIMSLTHISLMTWE